MGGPAEPGAWAESPPPELPTTLEVPVEMAARFEATLLRYELAEASLSCQDGTRVREVRTRLLELIVTVLSEETLSFKQTELRILKLLSFLLGD